MQQTKERLITKETPATKGKLITIEGCEGVGKSTQVNMLKAHFEQNSIPSVFVREPGGTQISEQIRQVILNPQNKMDSIAELFLYAAARCQLNAEVIRPAVEKGLIVVCDRYIDSTTAYQGFGRGIDLEIIKQVNNICLKDMEISLTLFLDLEPSRGFERKGGADKSDRLDSESLSFHQRVYEGYKNALSESENCKNNSKSNNIDNDKNSKNNGRIVAVDASKSAQQIFDSIIAALKERKII